MGIEMWVVPVGNDWWDKVPSIATRMGKFETVTPAAMPLIGEPPTTYWFKTREGGVGVLQIAGQTKKHTGRGPRGIRIRYKLLQQPKAPKAATQPATTRPASSQAQAAGASISSGPRRNGSAAGKATPFG